MPSFTEEELAARRSRIGASEIAAIIGADPYRGPMDVWMDKMGMKEATPETDAQAIGLAFEGGLAALYQRSLPLLNEGESIRLIGDGRTTEFLPNQPRFACTPDRKVQLVTGRGGYPALGPGIATRQVYPPCSDILQTWGLELKMRSGRSAHRWGESGTDEVPDEIALQCQWSMLVTGYTRWDVAVVLGGNEFRTYVLHRDERVLVALYEAGEQFLALMDSRTPPPIDASDGAAAFLRTMYPRHTQPLLVVESEELDKVAETLEADKLLLKEQEAAVTLGENLLKARIGAAEGVTSPRGWKATWKNAKDSQVVDYAAVAHDLAAQVAACVGAASEAVLETSIAAHTTFKPGSRRFLFTPAKD